MYDDGWTRKIRALIGTMLDRCFISSIWRLAVSGGLGRTTRLHERCKTVDDNDRR